jgi:hypothetical protein
MSSSLILQKSRALGGLGRRFSNLSGSTIRVLFGQDEQLEVEEGEGYL